MKYLSLATVALLSSVGLAAAADLPMRATAPAIPTFAAPAAFSWTGFHVGGHVGWAGADLDRRSTVTDPNQFNFVGQIGNGTYEPDGFIPVVTQNFRGRQNGVVGGIHAGYTHQFGAFVLGGEVDASFLQGSATGRVDRRVLTDFFNPGGGGLQIAETPIRHEVRASLDWLGTARIRAGFALDRVLVYATGGVAFGQANLRVSTGYETPFGGSESLDVRSSGTRFGYAIGGGIEFAATDNILLRAEYLRYDLGSRTVQGRLPIGPVGYRAQFRGDIVRAGIGYKF